jgi:hypothetical protein
MTESVVAARPPWRAPAEALNALEPSKASTTTSDARLNRRLTPAAFSDIAAGSASASAQRDPTHNM